MKIIVEGVEIELTQDQIATINAAKRPSPEQRLLEMLNGCVIKIDKRKYPDSVFFFKNDKMCFEIENSLLWCRYSLVWSVFEKEYNMEYSEIQNVIIEMVEQHFKMKGVTPRTAISSARFQVEQHFKMKGVTPRTAISSARFQVEQHFKIKGVTPYTGKAKKEK